MAKAPVRKQNHLTHKEYYLLCRFLEEHKEEIEAGRMSVDDIRLKATELGIRTAPSRFSVYRAGDEMGVAVARQVRGQTARPLRHLTALELKLDQGLARLEGLEERIQTLAKRVYELEEMATGNHVCQ